MAYLNMLGPVAASAADARLYSTWVPWQPDSVLAAWVIKRYVYSDAEFEALPRGTPIAKGWALDTPDSKYRRSGVRTAFEEALRLHSVSQDDCIKKLRPIVRILELAAWRKAEMPEAEQFESELLARLPNLPTKGGLTPAFEYINKFCGNTNSNGGRK